MVVHHEILREELEDHAVVHQLHEGGAVDGAVDVALLDLARAAEIDDAARVGAAHGGAADAHHGGFHGNLRRALRPRGGRPGRNRRRPSGPRSGPWSSRATAPRPQPRKRRRPFSSRQIRQRVFARRPTSSPTAYRSVSSSDHCRAHSFLCRNPVVQPQIESHNAGRALADFGIVRQETPGSGGRNCPRPASVPWRGLRTASRRAGSPGPPRSLRKYLCPGGPSSSSRRIMARTRARRAGSSAPP